MKDELHIKQQKHYPYVTKVNKKVNDRAATNNSIQFIQSTASSSVDWKLEDNTDQMNNF